MPERNQLIDELSELLFDIYLEGVQEVLYAYSMTHEGYYFITSTEHELFRSLLKIKFNELAEERQIRISEDAVFLLNKMVKSHGVRKL